MRVLHVITEVTKARGGPVSALAGILDLSAGLSWDSTVLCVGGDAEEQAFADGVELIRAGVKAPAKFFRSPEALRWLDAHWPEFDLIVLHEIWPLVILQAGRLLSRKGAPYLVMPHCSLDPLDLQKRRRAKQLLGRTHVRRTLTGARAVVTATTREADRMQCYGARPAVATLPLPVIADATAGDRTAFRSRMGAAPDDRIVLFLGRLVPVKGVDVLLAAVAACAERHPEVRLAIVGSGDPAYEAQLAAVAADLGIGSRVAFLGFAGSKGRADAFAGSDIFALTSHYESFGMAPLEAMGAGLPVLISRRAFLSDAIGDRGAGIVCDDTVESVAAGLARMLTLGSNLHAVADRGQAFVGSLRPAALANAYAQVLGPLARRAQHSPMPRLAAPVA